MPIADLLTAANVPPLWRAFILQTGGLRSDGAIKDLEHWPSWRRSGLKFSREVGEPLLAVAAIAYATMLMETAIAGYERDRRTNPGRAPVRFGDVAMQWTGVDLAKMDDKLLGERACRLADHAWAGLLAELERAELGQRSPTSHPRGRRSTSTEEG